MYSNGKELLDEIIRQYNENILGWKQKITEKEQKALDIASAFIYNTSTERKQQTDCKTSRRKSK